MKLITALAILVASFTALAESNDSLNFAFGGATTNSENATAMVAPILDDLAGSIGLELVGLSQQIDFSEAVLSNVNRNDVFWIWAGTNNILIAAETGNIEPTLAATELKAKMIRLYKNLDARTFVIPNLMLLGNTPKFNKELEIQDSINQLTLQHNEALKIAISEFKSEYSDALVIDLDVQSLFSQMEQSGEFSNISNACFFHGLPRGIPCEQYMYADDVHFSTAAAKKIAELAASKLANVQVNRLVVLGDSFSDTGSFSNTIKRAAGFGFPTFPFWEGRFCDGPNAIDQLKEKLNMSSESGAFEQPVRVSIVSGSNEVNREMIVPANISIQNESRFGLVTLGVSGKGTCYFWPDWNVDGHRSLSFCTGGLKAGSQVTATKVTLAAPFSSGPASMDVFAY